MPTFGFESEFQNNAHPLAAELFRLGLSGTDAIHGWHCDCGTCCDPRWPFKAQRDSSVDGEVISKVFTTDDWDEALAAMNGLQEAAIAADAEPGFDAGIHVHVQKPRGERLRAKAFLAFALWEPVLLDLAAGRFVRHRGWNRPVQGDCLTILREEGILSRYDRVTDVGDALALLAERIGAGEDDALFKASLLHDHNYDEDRHANLSTNTRFGTWEYRLWNSSRSAWRMELACRMSIALTKVGFVNHLLDHRGERSLDTLQAITTESSDDDRLAVLVSRQVAYFPTAPQAPATFLVA